MAKFGGSTNADETWRGQRSLPSSDPDAPGVRSMGQVFTTDHVLWSWLIVMPTGHWRTVLTIANVATHVLPSGRQSWNRHMLYQLMAGFGADTNNVTELILLENDLGSKVNTLGPSCLWRCFHFGETPYYAVIADAMSMQSVQMTMRSQQVQCQPNHSKIWPMLFAVKDGTYSNFGPSPVCQQLLLCGTTSVKDSTMAP